MNFSITQHGKPLNEDLYKWDEENKSFSTDESNLVLDFSGNDYILFKTGSRCVFKAGSFCVFETGSCCYFETADGCLFETGTKSLFKTGPGCVFKTGPGCVFKTGSRCVFRTSSNCHFNTGSYCTFKSGFGCSFETGSECVVIRRDVLELIYIPENKKIKLNRYPTRGYEYIEEKHIVTIHGKEVELSKESFENMMNILDTRNKNKKKFDKI